VTSWLGTENYLRFFTVYHVLAECTHSTVGAFPVLDCHTLLRIVHISHPKVRGWPLNAPSLLMIKYMDCCSNHVCTYICTSRDLADFEVQYVRFGSS
jgi:hypothetical protein